MDALHNLISAIRCLLGIFIISELWNIFFCTENSFFNSWQHKKLHGYTYPSSMWPSTKTMDTCFIKVWNKTLFLSLLWSKLFAKVKENIAIHLQEKCGGKRGYRQLWWDHRHLGGPLASWDKEDYER